MRTLLLAIGFSLAASGADLPADVVRRALEAQAAGDGAAFLAECDTQRFSAPAVARTADIVARAQAALPVRDFEFQALATAMGDKDRYAVVRAELSYVVVAAAEPVPVHFGVMVVLIRRDGGWRIVRTAPDDLLNLQFAAPRAVSGSKLPDRQSAAISLEDVNRRINEAMDAGHLNEEKLALTLAFSAVGQMPVLGDGVATVYQVYDTLSTAAESVRETWKFGLSSVALMKFTQVGVGIFQVITEPIPGADAMADAFQASFDQFTHSMEIFRALYELKTQLLRLDLDGRTVQPRLYPLRALEFDYAPGIETYPADGVAHSYGLPVAQISFTAPTVLGALTPFRVVGELPFSADSPIHVLGTRLGAMQRGDTWYLPVDVTHLAETDESRGDGILEGFARLRPPGSTLPFVAWTVTCRRGAQTLFVRLRNGETTVGIRVINDYMNKVAELRIPDMPSTGFTLGPGETRSGIRVIGASPQLEDRFWPDLTGRAECLDMAIADSAKAVLARAESVSLTGKANGATVWRLLMGGSSELPSVREVTRNVPVKVETPLLVRMHQARQIVVMLEGAHTCLNQSNAEYNCSSNTFSMGNVWNASHLGGALPENHLADLVWTGSTFVGVSKADCRLTNFPCEMRVEGSVDAASRTLTSLSVRMKLRAGSFDEDGTAVIKGPIPIVLDEAYTPSRPIAQIRGASAAQRIATWQYSSTWTNGRLSYRYVRTNFNDAQNPPVLTVRFH